jgi:HEAT repeat protein
MLRRSRSKAAPILAAAAVALAPTLAGCGGGPPAAEGVAPEAASRLAVGLKSKDPGVRCQAAISLSRMGPAAREAVPALAAALKDREPSVRAAAAQALGAVGPDAASARPALEALAKQATTRQVATEALEKIGR